MRVGLQVGMGGDRMTEHEFTDARLPDWGYAAIGKILMVVSVLAGTAFTWYVCELFLG